VDVWRKIGRIRNWLFFNSCRHFVFSLVEENNLRFWRSLGRDIKIPGRASNAFNVQIIKWTFRVRVQLDFLEQQTSFGTDFVNLYCKIAITIVSRADEAIFGEKNLF